MEITNKVKNSGLITIDLEDFVPNDQYLIALDIKDQLWQGLVLREKDFRAFISNENWSVYQGKTVHVYCSEDAIVPPWAYMLLASALHDYAHKVVFGNKQEAIETLVFEQILNLDSSRFKEARVVIKGCAKIPNIEKAFTAITSKLRGVAKSIMYGEPCSTVPIYKAPKAQSTVIV
jgi:hypothetical protein